MGEVWNGTRCQNCSVGSFKPSAGNIAPCQPCSDGTVTPQPGASHCGKVDFSEWERAKFPRSLKIGPFSLVETFYLLNYVTHRSEQLEFPKKKKKKILPDITMKLFDFCVIRNHRENEYRSALVNNVKLTINWVHVFFCDR